MKMKKIFKTAISAAAAALALAVVPAAADEFPEFKSSSSFVTIDSKELSDFKNVEALNKTAEKYEFSVYAYDETPSKKNESIPKGWVLFSKIKLSDYNERKGTGAASNVMNYKLTSATKFRYFAVTYPETKLKTRVELTKDGTSFLLTLFYDQPIKPLASLSVEPALEKNSKKEVVGVNAEISFRNISMKDISDLTLTISALKKGTIVKTKTGGLEETRIAIGAVIKDGERYELSTASMWDDTAIDTIKVQKVEINYIDGTHQEY